MADTPVRGTLFEMAFESRLSELEETDIARLIGGSWHRNRRAGITGEMRLAGRAVVQVVEGETSAVLALAARILADPRHSAVTLTSFGPISARRFSDWRIHGFEPGLAREVLPEGESAAAWQAADRRIRRQMR